MIKDKKEKQSGGSSSSSGGGGSSSGGNNGNSKSNNNASNAANSSSTNNNASTSSPSSSKTSNSQSSASSTSSSGSTKSGGSNNANNKSNILGIKEEIIEQGPTEQLVVTSIKHEDGSPPTNIIKKEPANPSSSSGGAGTSGSGSSSTSTVNNSNDSNNNNDTNDNKNNSNLSGNPDEKDSANDNSITDELLHNDDLNSSGNNSSANKLGHHIKSEQDTSSGVDPLGGVDNTFGQMNSQQPGSNRPSMMTSPERIQPLPSNVVNKSNSMDYMQQQSQIFVFSTALANKGAEAVRNGQFPTIIAFHCAQPDTRKILSKFPLKTNQFNRSPNWFPPNMNPMGNPSGPKRSKMMPMNQQNFNFMNKNSPMNPQQQQPPHQQQQGGPVNNNQMVPQGFQGSCDMNMGPGGDLWGGPGNQQMNMDPLGNGPNSIDPLLSDSIDSLVNDPLSSNSMSNLQGGFMDPTSPSIPSLQGVKVPDEDLTPQQRQERVKKLKQLEELKQMFKQEHPLGANELNPLGEQEVPSGVPPGGPNMNLPCNKMGPNPIGGPMNPMMNSPHGNMPMNPGGMNGPMRPNFPMGPRGPGMGNIRGQMPPNMGGGMNMNPEEMMMSGNVGSPMGPGGPGGMNNMHMQGGPGNMMNMQGMGPQHMQGGNNMGMNQMVPGNCGGMPGGPNMMGNQKGMVGPGGPMGAPGGNMHMDWKMQQQYYDESKRKGMGPGGMDMPMNDMNMPGMAGPGGRMGPMNRNPNMPNMPNMRLPQQGPPPPYHQTPRSASVPIATQSPNPNSPNNPTSNLSLPSPRGGCNSTLNSPAAGDPSRMNPQQFKHMNPRQSPTTSSQDSPAGAMGGRQINHSNPSTPISSHLSPSASLKDLEMSTNPNKEPNLMPVPSPQQISYLNTFEGQELTIQKQPNTNINNKDGAPNMVGPNQANMNLDNRLPGQKTPTSSANPHMNNFPIPSSPLTPGAPSLGGDKNRINPSPQGNLQRSNSMMGNDPNQQFPPHLQGSNQQSNESNMPFSTDGQNMPFGPNSQLPQGNAKMPNFMDQKPGDMSNGPPQFPQCGGRPENLPLNPNSNATMPNTKPSHFDPISSLAQMSQQLTSTGVPGPMNGQPMMGGFNNNGMMNDMGPMGGMNDGQMDFGGGNMGGMGGPNQFPMGGPRSMSPKIGPQQMGFPGGPGGMPPMRMVRPPMGYNGTNIQVKPNAPNTIQYLPARPQMNNANPPRGPPSLEFLQRYTNPMSMDEMNKGAPGGNQQNMPYFPNQNNPSSCANPMDPLGDGGGPNSMIPGSGPPHGMMNQNSMMMRGPGGGPMRGSGGNMMRFPSPNANMGGNPCMMGNNTFNSSNNPNMGPNDHQMNQMMMFGGGAGGPNQQNPQMFVPGPKSSPMGGPPVVNSDMQMGGGMVPMGGGNAGQPHFNKQQQQQQSHFPSTADPNYAQQFHNFQQQLYATNNPNQRNQMGMQNQTFMPKQ